MKLFILLYGCLLVLGRSISAEDKLLRELLDESVYDQATRPRDIKGGDGPCIVEIDMVLNAVGPVSSLNMELTTSFYLRQEWVDPRLRFNSILGKTTFEVGHKYLDKLWLPDLFFTMGTQTKRHEMTTPNVLIRLSSDGTVFFSQRITSTMKCFMDLTKFPHDRQNCKSSMMSYSYTTDDIVFQWSSKRQATSVLPSAFLAEFTLSEVAVNDCTETFATGTFTCLEAILVLDREIGYYLTQTYIPSVLIVMLSWAAFWIDHEAVPARISVGLLTVLTITTQSTGARAELPRVSYVKAIDVWMSMNLVFVFAAYMEYAVVTVMSRRYKRKLRKQSEINFGGCMAHAGSASHQDTNSLDGNCTIGTTQRSRSNSTLSTPSQIVHVQFQAVDTFAATSDLSTPIASVQTTQPSMINVEMSKQKIKKRSKNRRRSVARRKKDRLIFKRNFGRRVDFHSRYVFPVAYVLFNIGYWSGYLLTEKASV